MQHLVFLIIEIFNVFKCNASDTRENIAHISKYIEEVI